jgi:hypothetical protein
MKKTYNVCMEMSAIQLRELAILWLRYAPLEEVKGNVANELEGRFVTVDFDRDEDEPYES